MSRAGSSIAIALLALTISGCAGTTTSYTNPKNYTVITEKIISEDFDSAWNLYVAELSKSFFVINNISKESRILNVSFGSNSPSDYVDCGRSTRTTQHPALGTKTYSYAVADDSTYMYGMKGTNHLWEMNRNTRLEGRANVYMAPDPSGTLLRANAKYVWSVAVTGRSNVGGYVSENVTLDFSSREEATQTDQDDGGPVTWRCRSNGSLEKRLLNLIPSS